jgi:hypothetical protein
VAKGRREILARRRLGHTCRAGRQPLLPNQPRSRWTTGHRPATARRPYPVVCWTVDWSLPPPLFSKFFSYFLFLFLYYEEVWGWAWDFGKMDVQHSHFFTIFGMVKSSIPHGAWRFHVFPKRNSKIKVIHVLHINCWDFCLMKK